MDETPASPEIIAHRGYSAVAPENTLEALDSALDAGATSLEVDLQTAIDGTPVLFHDVHLGRTTNGVGPVRRRTVGQIKALDAGSWFSEGFEGTRVPTLAEALDHLRDRIEAFYPEVKGYREMEDLDRMLEITRSAGLLARTSFISLDPIVLGRLRQTDPSVSLGYVVDEVERVGAAIDRCVDDGNAWLDLKAEIALERPAVVESARARGVVVGVWTVNRVEEARVLRDLGVTRFTTDQVEPLVAWARDEAS